MKTIYNLDKIKICLLQPSNFFENLYEKITESDKGIIEYDGFFLKADKKQVNDKDIVASLFTIEEEPMLLGTFVFNKSKKFDTKCFFSYSTKVLYEVSYRCVFETQEYQYNYFSMPFYAFDFLNLSFNNVSYIEIAADTEESSIKKIQYAVSHPEIYDMVLLWKKVIDDTQILSGYWEFFQRSRTKRATSPTLYVHSLRATAGNRKELKVYDKARELAQNRTDKEALVKAWNGMNKKIERLEISLENKPFQTYFRKQCASNPNRWMPLYIPENLSLKERKNIEKDALEHFFFDLGMDEALRKQMFVYFANQLLHFKLKDRNHTPISIIELNSIPFSALKSL